MTIAFIPVRGGSKSIPLKNIKPLCGKPLVYWNLQALEETDRIDKVVVATDSDEIRDAVAGFGFSKTILYERDNENARDESSTEAVMLEYLEAEAVDDNDLFMLVQATSPLTSKEHFSEALDLFYSGNKDSVLSCVKTKRFFWNGEGTPVNYDYKNRPRRQDFDGLYMENGAFYINKAGNIRRDKNRLSGSIAVYEMPEYTAVEIDEEDDWLLAEKLMVKYRIPTVSASSLKLFLTDVDGTLTDAGMYYDEKGNELKKFNTRDGKGIELLRDKGIKTGIITSESTNIVSRRAEKLKVDYLYQGLAHKGKLEITQEICQKEGITLQNVAYIGDDINCLELLQAVGFAGCPFDAVPAVQAIPGIQCVSRKGGEGAVRAFIDQLLSEKE